MTFSKSISAITPITVFVKLLTMMLLNLDNGLAQLVTHNLFIRRIISHLVISLVGSQVDEL